MVLFSLFYSDTCVQNVIYHSCIIYFVFGRVVQVAYKGRKLNLSGVSDIFLYLDFAQGLLSKI